MQISIIRVKIVPMVYPAAKVRPLAATSYPIANLTATTAQLILL
jgi:hypothetical protein